MTFLLRVAAASLLHFISLFLEPFIEVQVIRTPISTKMFKCFLSFFIEYAKFFAKFRQKTFLRILMRLETAKVVLSNIYDL